jgi:hypothetical protein
MYRDIANVEHEMCDHTSSNWSNQKNWEALPGKHFIDSPQTTAMLGTSHILQKVLHTET